MALAEKVMKTLSPLLMSGPSSTRWPLVSQAWVGEAMRAGRPLMVQGLDIRAM
ncbi:hypothetical protein SBADM41S_09759 [Streptomyces badius]